MASSVYLGVDMGGTRIKCGVLRDNTVLAHHVFASKSHRTLAEALEETKQVIMRLLEQNRLSLRDCRGVGWGFPAIADHASYRVRGDFRKFADAAGHDFEPGHAPSWACPVPSRTTHALH